MDVTVNQVRYPLDGVTPHVNALDWLRSNGLTGCKEGCAEGECGACSVLVARDDDGRTTWTAVNACLVPMATLDGQEIVTSEGLGRPGSLHPVQQAMAKAGGSQCGYCTPGFVCSMAAEFYRADRTRRTTRDAGNGVSGHGDGSAVDSAAPDHEHGTNGFDLHALSGNLCRCTGYRPIRDAAYELPDARADDPLTARLERPAPAAVGTRLGGDGFVRPTSLAETLDLLAVHPDAVLVAGATDYGVEVNLRGRRAAHVIAIDRLPELRTLAVTDDAVELGAALTLSEVERGLRGRVPLLDELWPQFASRLIRNSATIGGNLGTGSPIGDTPPALLALDAELVLSSSRGERTVPLTSYFTGYRQSVREPDELIARIRIPLPAAALSAFHKIAKRRFDDISSVAVAYAFEVSGGTIQRAAIGLGGVAATPIRATATERALIGRPWTQATIDEAAAELADEGTPMSDHRASAAYRAAMLGESLRKFYAESSMSPRRTNGTGRGVQS